jgi:hypothetical protein
MIARLLFGAQSPAGTPAGFLFAVSRAGGNPAVDPRLRGDDRRDESAAVIYKAA